MRLALRAGADRPVWEIAADAGATLCRSFAGLLDSKLLTLNLLLSVKKNLRISALLFQLAQHFFEEVDYLPAFRWLPLFSPSALAVVECSQIVKLQVFLF